MKLRTSNKELSKLARLEVLDMIFNSKSSHIGSCFSCIDIISVIYNKILNLKKLNLTQKIEIFLFYLKVMLVLVYMLYLL